MYIYICTLECEYLEYSVDICIYIYHIPGMMIHRGVETSENVIQILLETEMGFESSSGVRDSRIHDVISWLGDELDRFKQWEKPWSLKLKVIQSWYRYGISEACQRWIPVGGS